jgi:hypothetical protein
MVEPTGVLESLKLSGKRALDVLGDSKLSRHSLTLNPSILAAIMAANRMHVRRSTARGSNSFLAVP